MKRASRNYGIFYESYKGWEIRYTNGKRWGKYFAFCYYRLCNVRLTHYQTAQSIKKAIDDVEYGYTKRNHRILSVDQ